MDPLNLLVVERGADWTHWARTSHLVGHAMLVLAQQGDEPTADFRRRIRTKLSRVKKQGLASVVLLRGDAQLDSSSESLMSDLMMRAPADFRVYPAARPAVLRGRGAHSKLTQYSEDFEPSSSEVQASLASSISSMRSYTMAASPEARG